MLGPERPTLVPFACSQAVAAVAPSNGCCRGSPGEGGGYELAQVASSPALAPSAIPDPSQGTAVLRHHDPPLVREGKQAEGSGQSWTAQGRLQGKQSGEPAENR